MGRKTFESLGRPLPARTNVVLSRESKDIPGVTVLSDVADLRRFGEEIFVIGGAQIYAQLLPWCSELFLSVVQREVEGDTFFPEFEDRFELVEVLTQPEFNVLHYKNRFPLPPQ
jgi:dihydrofolate reductase